MREFQGKRRLKQFFYSRVTVALLILVVLLLARAAAGVWWRSRGVAEERQAVDQELAEAVSRRQELTASIARLETARGVEAELRSKFSVARPGERVISVISSASAEPVESPDRGWWDWVKNFLRD